MPRYIYQNPKDPEDLVEVVQGMSDEHVYYGEDGEKWNRVFTVPSMTMDQSIDPFSGKDFLRATKNVKTYGEAMDISKEMSAARAEKLGAPDPILKKAEDKFYKPTKIKKNK